MTPTEDLEMDDYERELVEEAWGFAQQTGWQGPAIQLDEAE